MDTPRRLSIAAEMTMKLFQINLRYYYNIILFIIIILTALLAMLIVPYYFSIYKFELRVMINFDWFIY